MSSLGWRGSRNPISSEGLRCSNNRSSPSRRQAHPHSRIHSMSTPCRHENLIANHLQGRGSKIFIIEEAVTNWHKSSSSFASHCFHGQNNGHMDQSKTPATLRPNSVAPIAGQANRLRQVVPTTNVHWPMPPLMNYQNGGTSSTSTASTARD